MKYQVIAQILTAVAFIVIWSLTNHAIGFEATVIVALATIYTSIIYNKN